MKILIPVDGSEYSMNAVTFASKLLNQCSEIEAVLVSVIYPFMESNAGTILEAARKRIQTNGTKVKTIVMEGDPADTIIKYAKQNAVDLVIMGGRGLGAIKGMVLGSVSNKVLGGLNIPVTIVK